MTYNNKNKNHEPINVKRLIFNLLLWALAIYIGYDTYQSYQFNQQKAHYDSNIKFQYANVHQLLAVLYHSPDEFTDRWSNKIVKLSMNDVNEFCDVIENNKLISTTDNYTLEGELVPKWVKSNKVTVVTALTEFKCKLQPP